MSDLLPLLAAASIRDKVVLDVQEENHALNGAVRRGQRQVGAFFRKKVVISGDNGAPMISGHGDNDGRSIGILSTSVKNGGIHSSRTY